MPGELDLREAVAARANALAAGDAQALDRLLHPDFRWTSHRGEIVDRARYVRNNTSGALVWRSQELLDVTVTEVDDTGVVTATAVDDVERDGIAMRFRMPMTQTWVRQGGRWRCLAGHAGPVLE